MEARDLLYQLELKWVEEKRRAAIIRRPYSRISKRQCMVLFGSLDEQTDYEKTLLR